MCDEVAQRNLKLTKYIHREIVIQKSFTKNYSNNIQKISRNVVLFFIFFHIARGLFKENLTESLFISLPNKAFEWIEKISCNKMLWDIDFILLMAG